MIARIWKGKTRIEHLEIYRKIIVERDMPNYRKAKGFVKLTFLIRINNEYAYFKLITFWQNFDAITNFAGPDYRRAIAYKEDKKYLVNYPGMVVHYLVFEE